jgi:hypothetical protein
VVIMVEKEDRLTMEEFHKKVAVETNNQIWPVLDARNPTEAQLETALHMAYTSRYHWSKIGTAVNAVRAEYMIARVYSAMKRSEPALFHAKRCLEIAKESDIEDWDLAFVYEVMARAHSVAGNKTECEKYHELAQNAINEIKNPEDKKICQGELDKITC